MVDETLSISSTTGTFPVLNRKKITLEVYLNTGIVFEYEVENNRSAREHASKIIKTGFRCTVEGEDDLTWYPPHVIEKVKIKNGAEGTNYKVKYRAT